jgi:hypothetical protein
MNPIKAIKSSRSLRIESKFVDTKTGTKVKQVFRKAPKRTVAGGSRKAPKEPQMLSLGDSAQSTSIWTRFEDDGGAMLPDPELESAFHSAHRPTKVASALHC